MIEQELTYQDLRIPSSEIYEAMGYKDSIPDQMVIDETNTLLKRVIPLLRPRFAFFFMEGTLDIEKRLLAYKASIHPLSILYKTPFPHGALSKTLFLHKVKVPFSLLVKPSPVN